MLWDVRYNIVFWGVISCSLVEIYQSLCFLLDIKLPDSLHPCRNIKHLRGHK